MRGAGLLFTFGQRVPAGPVGDPLVEEVSTVPAFVHPAVCVRVRPRQLSAHTDTNKPVHPHVYNAADSREVTCLPIRKSAAHLPEDLVIRSGGIRGPSSNAKVSRLVKGVVGHDGATVEVGRQHKVVALHPLDDGQSLWFNLGGNLGGKVRQETKLCTKKTKKK